MAIRAGLLTFNNRVTSIVKHKNDGTVIGVGAYIWNDVNIGNVMGYLCDGCKQWDRE